MAIKTTVKGTQIGVGDKIRIIQKIKEKDKERNQAFDGMVIAIKGEGENKSFTVRKIGVQQIGIERIYPVLSPSIVEVHVIREGLRGVRRSKLYYIRDKSKKEIEQIYTRAKRKKQAKTAAKSDESPNKIDKPVKSASNKSKKAVKKTPTKKPK